MKFLRLKLYRNYFKQNLWERPHKQGDGRLF